jgi:hypothetical protein
MHSRICNGWLTPKFGKLRANRIGLPQVGHVATRSMQIVSKPITHPMRNAEKSPVSQPCALFVSRNLKRDPLRHRERKVVKSLQIGNCHDTRPGAP